jgi:UDP-N-acetylglucosamine 4-epimerase
MTSHAVNVDGFVNMLAAAKDAGVARFVYASSSAVYGDSATQPQTEARVGRPLSPYAATKAINESYAVAFQMTYGMQTVGLRYFNIFGPRQDPDGAYAAVIPRWIANLMTDRPCIIFGDGSSTRDYCHVSNVVQANILAATTANEAATGEAYNIACAQSLSLTALFGLMRETVARQLPSVAHAHPEYQPYRTGDIPFSSGSIEKACQQLEFSPTHSVIDGMTETVAWYVDQSRTLMSAEAGYAR